MATTAQDAKREQALIRLKSMLRDGLHDGRDDVTYHFNYFTEQDLLGAVEVLEKDAKLRAHLGDLKKEWESRLNTAERQGASCYMEGAVVHILKELSEL